jgi:hypothetical protein
MADVQDDVRQELVWDQPALAAADLVTDARVTQAGVTLPVAGLYPSLHLNLSECYLKLGDLGRAREHLQQAQAAVGALGDDGYAQMIKSGPEWLAERLTSLQRRLGSGTRAWWSRTCAGVNPRVASGRVRGDTNAATVRRVMGWAGAQPKSWTRSSWPSCTGGAHIPPHRGAAHRRLVRRRGPDADVPGQAVPGVAPAGHRHRP